jgi:uncharacterized CHY-type Zn-finger protein
MGDSQKNPRGKASRTIEEGRQTMNKHECKYCGEQFGEENNLKKHYYVEHPKKPNPLSNKIGRKYGRIVGNIERCFFAYEKSNIAVLSTSQIESWYNERYKNGITKQRLSHFLRTRSQFRKVKKARFKSTNLTESWWSLGEVEGPIDVDISGHWVEVPLVDN